MFEATIFNTVVYGVGFSFAYYALICLYAKRVIALEFRKMLFYITVFCLFGVSGEIFTNTIWHSVFGQPLWEYRLFPVHAGNVSYFFILVWGALGYYRYLNDLIIHRFNAQKYILPGLVMGAEAIFLELLYNGLFLVLFGNYIFYYLPDNLWIFSHLSCLQVIPFYFLVGLVTNALIIQQNKIGYGRSIFFRISFYWMVIATLIFF